MPVTRAPDFDRLRRQVYSALQRGLRDSNSLAERAVKKRYTGPTGPASLSRRSSRLVTAVRREIKGGPPPEPIVARVYMPKGAGGRYNPVYAGIHETGGIIRPRRGRYLTFAVGPYVTATRRGPPFVRVKQVRIPARPVWATTRREVEVPIEKRMERAINEAVRGF